MLHANQVSAGQGWKWVTRGIALLRQTPTLWLSMAFIYLVLYVVLEFIPFIGWLILALFTPILMLGALGLAASQADNSLPADAVPVRPAGPGFAPWRDYLMELFSRAGQRLFQGFKEEDKLLPIMVISTLLLGGLVVVRILAQLLKVGGAAIPAMLSGSVGPSVWLTALLGLLIVLTLETLLIMAFLYVVPLILFQREYPLPAIQASFVACLNNLGALAVFGTVFALAGMVSRGLFHMLPFPLDYLAFLVIGLVSAPVFVAGLFAGYQDLFPAARTKPR